METPNLTPSLATGFFQAELAALRATSFLTFDHPPGNLFPLGIQPFFQFSQDLRGGRKPSKRPFLLETKIQIDRGEAVEKDRADADQQAGVHRTSDAFCSVLP